MDGIKKEDIWKIASSVEHIKSKVNELKRDTEKIKKTLDGDGSPSGGLITTVEKNKDRINLVSKVLGIVGTAIIGYIVLTLMKVV